MINIKQIQIPGYEKVLEITDPKVDLHAFIALHNTSLGPALGGVRIFPYPSKEEALTDVLRLAKAMTYKSALCENGLGGGKSVLITKNKTKEMLLAFAEAINHLKGLYIAAEDMGSSPEDMATLSEVTPFVSGLPTKKSSGDPSRFTARGLFFGMQAIAKTLWNTTSLKGKTIAIQGLGHVGSLLANFLFWEEAELILSDIHIKKAEDFASLLGAKVVDSEDIYSVTCDIFSPCALGGILTSKTTPSLNCKAVAGSANNQLLTPEDGNLLFQRGILYAPDYIINSGGIINAAAEFDKDGYNAKNSLGKVKKIYQTLLKVFEKAKQENRPTHEIADELAEYNLKRSIGKRENPIDFLSRT